MVLKLNSFMSYCMLVTVMPDNKRFSLIKAQFMLKKGCECIFEYVQCYVGSLSSVVCIVTRLQAEISGVDFWEG